MTSPLLGAEPTPSRPRRGAAVWAVTLLSFSSGLPLGLVWIAIPDWMRSAGVDIRIVGLTSLAQAPWTFKMLWSPFLDRYPLPWLGRRRGWIAVFQIGLVATTLLLSGAAARPDAPWVLIALCLAIAIAAASQDIVIDAYAVDVLRPDEQGLAVGGRTAAYRAAMFVSGGFAITIAPALGWPVVSGLLAAAYLPLLLVTLRAPEPEQPAAIPPTIRQAVWQPFLGFLARHRALEILGFVLLYKFADNLAEALLRPFLVDCGYDAFHRGLGLTAAGTVATVAGTVLGGMLTNPWGLGRCLWVFGVLQIVSNVGYLFLADNPPNLPLFYGALGFESVTKGLGMGAFGVLLLRLTQKRFSATQYALFSSLFGLPRLVAGPITGFLVHAIGWKPFFWLTMVLGLPGLVLLARFVSPRDRDPVFTVEPPHAGPPIGIRALVARGLAGGLAGATLALIALATLGALERFRATASFGWLESLGSLLAPADLASALQLSGALVCGVVCGLGTAAITAARHGPPPPGQPGDAGEADSVP